MNLSMLLDMAEQGIGDRSIIGHTGEGMTARRLHELSIGAADVITSTGADALVYLAVNGPAFPVALFAAARAGVPLVPMNYRLGTEQLDSLLALHPNALTLVDPHAPVRVTPAGKVQMTVDEFIGQAAARSESGSDAVETDRPAVLIYTSGTTSAPKGVEISHDNLISYVFGSVDFASAAESDAALISVPPYHIAAVANAVTNIFAGRRTVILEQFTPEGWLDMVRRERVTHALIVPTMLARIVAADHADRTVPTLRSLAYGGAPMPVPVVTAAMRLWPHVDFVNAYGLTETSSTIAVLGPEDHRAALESTSPAVRARLGSAGRVLSTVELEIRDIDGASVPAGVVGRIWVRGAQVSGTYAGSGSSTDAAGWFDTRDEGHLDADGFLFISGRTDDTIIRGAENIAPAEIENVLLAHEDIEDAAVVGIPDDEWGQRIEAVVVLRRSSTTTAELLREYVREHLRSAKTPDRIELWDELPRTETGKLIRREITRRLVVSDPAPTASMR